MNNMKRIIALILAIMCVVCLPAYAFADEAAERTGSINLYKYDITSAVADGVWNSSYVSTGIRDENGVESILGSSEHMSAFNADGDAYGYAIKGVEFTYLKVGSAKEFTRTEDGTEYAEVLYGFANNSAFLNAIGVSADARVQNCDEADTYYYQADVIINGLKTALEANSTTVKNALEAYVKSSGGTTMAATDAYGHSAADGLPLGLYLLVETKVPEMVTDTTAPFLINLPMTSADGSDWIYDVTVYPKNMTGMPTLEKTVREAKVSTGKNNGSAAINDGYAHTATASDGDTVEYQIISTLPTVTSESSYLTEYTFVDTLSKGISYKKGDVTIEFFRDKGCTDKVASWKEADGKFTATYKTTDKNESEMTIAMTADGLKEINSSKTVYTGTNAVNSGYSDCTMRITYAASVNSDSSVVYGDNGNPNKVTLTWRRTNSEYFDTLKDDCHVFTYGLDLTKKFSDGAGKYDKVKFTIHNKTDGYYLTAKQTDGIYYVTGHTEDKASATIFNPNSNGHIVVKGVEDDVFVATETATDDGYVLLKDGISVEIAVNNGTVCNDCGAAKLTASAKVNKNAATMTADNGSNNAIAPLTVVNNKGFNLPQTGDYGTWMYGVGGVVMMGLAAVLLVWQAKRDRKESKSK